MNNYRRFDSLDRKRMALAPALLLAWLFASPAFAQPSYTVDLGVFVNSQGVFEGSTPGETSSNSVSVSQLYQLPGATGFGSAAAGPGSLAVIGSAVYSVIDPTNETSAQGVATAISTVDDLVFSGVGTLNGVFLMLDLTGSMSVFGTASVATSSLTLSFKLQNQSFDAFRTVQLPAFFFVDGVLDGIWPQGVSTFSGPLLVGPFNNVPTNTNLSLRMSMSVSPGAFIFPNFPAVVGNAASAQGDLGNTLSFTSSGPVFSTDDPNFISVNSVQASIVNGIWTGSPVSASPIPGPPEVPALNVGMSLLLALLIVSSAMVLRFWARAA